MPLNADKEQKRINIVAVTPKIKYSKFTCIKSQIHNGRTLTITNNIADIKFACNVCMVPADTPETIMIMIICCKILFDGIRKESIIPQQLAESIAPKIKRLRCRLGCSGVSFCTKIRKNLNIDIAVTAIYQLLLNIKKGSCKLKNISDEQTEVNGHIRF